MMKDYGIVQVTGAAKALWQSFRPNTGGHGGNRRAPELRAGHQAPEAADFGRQDETDGGRRAPEAADFSLRDEIDANGLSTRPEGSATEVLKVSDLGFLILGEEQIDIRMLHDIASIPQLNAIAFLVRKLINQVNPLERFQKFTMGEQYPGQPQDTAPKWICRQREVERVLAEIEEAGLESAYSPFFSECSRWMDMPRKYEMLAVLSRMRLRV